MLKNFMMKQMLKSQMKDVPEEEQERILKMVSDNPQFFENIAAEIQKKQSEGKDQISAILEVMTVHKDELQKMLGGEKK